MEKKETETHWVRWLYKKKQQYALFCERALHICTESSKSNYRMSYRN